VSRTKKPDIDLQGDNRKDGHSLSSRHPAGGISDSGDDFQPKYGRAYAEVIQGNYTDHGMVIEESKVLRGHVWRVGHGFDFENREPSLPRHRLRL
jgi:hypothetical protein